MTGRSSRILTVSCICGTATVDSLAAQLRDADTEAAIQAAQQSVESTPDNHPNRAHRSNNLGTQLGCRFQRTGDIADREAAIQAAQHAHTSTSTTTKRMGDLETLELVTALSLPLVSIDLVQSRPNKVPH